MIKYSISKDGFKYNMKKGTLKAGSIISNKEHPIKEVNDYRNQLIADKKVKKIKNNYVVIKPIKTGMLMAYNLHHGILKKQIDNEEKIYVDETTDKDIIESFDIKNMYRTDSSFINRLRTDENRIIGIYKYKINADFFRGSSPNEFSETELFVANFLKEKEEINNYRHGETAANEADIVDEINKKQIEVIFEYKNKISKRGKVNADPLLISELIDTDLIKTSDALIKKLYKKKYDEKYEKQLAILCIGNKASTKTMLVEIQNNIEKMGYPKNAFKRIYIICIDIIDDILFYYNGNKWDYEKNDKYSKKIMSKRKIQYDEIVDDEEYLLETKNIFSGEKGIGILDGKTIKQLSKDTNLIA